jgi:hypothetical protein
MRRNRSVSRSLMVALFAALTVTGSVVLLGNTRTQPQSHVYSANGFDWGSPDPGHQP